MTFEELFVTYVLDKDFYTYAYEHSEVYRKFIEKFGPDYQKILHRYHNSTSALKGVQSFRKGLFVFATGPIGWAAAGAVKAGKAIANRDKMTKAEYVEATVNSPEFDELFRPFVEERD